MSATLGALVIAISTEFSVILSSRYFEEREAGHSLGEALRRSYSRTGAAVAASGVTAIAGFAVLAVSDVRMLRDFGLVTVLDLAVALIGVMVVLPATLVAAEDGIGSLLRSGPTRAVGAARDRRQARGAALAALMAERGRGADRKAPKPGGRYIAFVGVAFATLIVIATVNTLKNTSAGVLGLNADIAGRALPEFAVPDVRGSVDADANVFQDDCSSSENPCPAEDRRPSACQIKPAGAIRVCDYFDKPLAISFWFMKGANCLPAQDAFNRVAARFRGRANFLSINVRDDRDSVQQTVIDHGWTLPVGWDRDGAVSDVYRVGVCPAVAFVYPGGIYAFARAGEDVTQPKLAGDVRELLRRSSERAKASR